MKWLKVFILVIAISILLPSGIVLADSPSVDDVKVFQDYKETGDWLIVSVYNISGTNTTTSSCDVYNNKWKVELIDNVAGTIYTIGDIKQCGMRPVSIYINATMAASPLVWGGNYSVKINASWGTLPSASRTINNSVGNSDWIGSNLVGLDQWVISRAKIIGLYDGVSYIDTVPIYGEVLNPTAGTIFKAGIPYLSFRPDIFEVTTVTIPIGYIPSNGNTSYADDLYTNWDTVLGPDVSGALTSIAPYFGFTGIDGGRMVCALLTIIGFLSLAIIEKSVAFMVILGGVMIGVFPMATVILFVFILSVLLVRSLFWSST